MNYLLAAFPIISEFKPAERFKSGGELFGDIITILISAGAIMAIFFIIIGGIKMVTGGGDPKRLEVARNTVFYALTGLAVTALAFVILQVVQYMLQSKIPITS